MNNKMSSNRAFSLIELSIVILIIGILVAGVTSSSRLVTRMRVLSIQNLTRGAPVSSIKDLVLWYETSLDESFDTAEEVEDATISNWFDLNAQSSFKVNATQGNINARPKYKNNVINGLPSLFFDGVDDHFIVPSPGISGRGLTIFIVGQRRGLGTFQGLLSGMNMSTMTDEAAHAGGFQAFYDHNDGRYITISSGVWYSSPSQTVPRDNTPYILQTIFNGSNNISYINKNVGPVVNGSPTFNVDRLYIGCRYVNNPVFYFWGNISEIIIFNRGLSTEERLAIASYLSKKYAINLV